MRVLAMAALFVACNSTHNPVTDPGTVVVDWNTTKSTRAAAKTASIGPHTVKDYVVEVHRKNAPALTYDLHLELAPYQEAGSTETHTAPVAIVQKVKDNTGWEVSGHCGDGPFYQFGPVDAKGAMSAPAPMRQDCYIHEHRIGGHLFTDSWDVITTLEILGDGTVEARPADEVVIRAAP